MPCPTHGINPNSKERVAWDILMMCCLIWVASESARAHEARAAVYNVRIFDGWSRVSRLPVPSW